MSEPGANSAVRPLGAHDPTRLGPHRLVGRLGSGGMGTVYLARSWFGSPVAVKAVHPELADEPEFRARFAREVGTLSRVRSPFVPRFAGAAPQADIPWLATAYVVGPTLREQIEGAGPLRGGSLSRLASGTASALVDIHAAGVVHRDLKPSNVILSPDGPRVLDFGIARTLDGTARTRTGGMMGTPGWIAPERFLGAPATTASDMFSWGQLTAYAATGRNPFGGGDADTVTQRVLRGEANLNGVPAELLPLVRTALDPVPEHRPAPDHVLRALRGGRGVPDTGAPATRIMRGEWPPPGPAVDGASRHRRVIRRGATAVAVALAVAAGTAVGLRSGEEEAPGDTVETSVAGADTDASDGVGPEGEEEARVGEWPPPEATDSATNAGRGNRVTPRTEYPSEDSAERSDWAEFALGAPPSAFIRVSPAEKGPDGAIVFTGSFWGDASINYSYGFSEEQFAVVTEESVFSPRVFETDPPGELPDDLAVEFTMAFEGAPETGLLVVRENGYVEDVDGAPPVGICYSVPNEAFSADYPECT